MRWTASLLMVACLVATGCKKKESSKPAPPPPTSIEPVAPSDPEAAQGFALGQEIGKTNLAMVEELAALVVSKPEPSAVHGSVEAVKSKYIDLFVALGRRREALSAKAKGAVDRGSETADREANAKMPAVYAAINYYGKKEAPAGGKALSDLLKGVPQLPMYANFTALKRLKPDEAARLDIK